MGISEMMCIEILYHHSGYKCFRYYYRHETEKGYLNSYFPAAPSYNTSVHRKPRMLTCQAIYPTTLPSGATVRGYYAVSTKLAVCNDRRIHSHKVFKKQVAQKKLPRNGSIGLNSSGHQRFLERL